MSLLANSNAMTAQGGGYTISNSLRFQSASSTYLNRTFSTPTNNTTWSFSCWLKRGSLSSVQGVISSTNAGLFFSASDAFYITNNAGVAAATSTAVFRDPSAWYHIFVVSNGTTIVGYINNAQVFSFTGTITNFNSAIAHGIGRFQSGASQYFDGYMADIYLVDGQALTPSSFGLSDPYTGQWEAKKYTGTYGTNGFYLPFSNGTSTVTLGVDYSGNNNNWALNAFTRSAGVSDCWMKDVPSGNGFGGVNASSNYAVLSPIGSSTSAVESEANLKVTTASASPSNFFKATSTIAPSSGKWYFESTIGAIATNNLAVCISGTQTIVDASSQSGLGSGEVSYFGRNGAGTPVEDIYVNGVSQFTGTAANANDVIGVAFDADNRTVQFYRNNTAKGSAYTITSANAYYISAIVRNNTTASIQYLNFGQRSFAYTPPTGFLPLCTANLPSPTIWQGNQYMDATLYTGNGGSQTITNAGGFSPDLVWTKARSTPSSHQLYNSVTGVNIYLKSNSTDAEVSLANTLTSFNSNGFTLGANDSGNQSGTTAVAWQWDAGTSTVTNTDGTISSQVRANTTAGFSIVTYTGNSSASATVGHGLGVAPKMIIVKERSTNVSGWNTWVVYHESLGNTRYILLNTTAAAVTTANAWNNTSPTSSVFTVAFNAGAGVNYNSATYVAYCFAEIAGFSKFGSYTGNGSTDGPFIYLGFRPKFVMIKRTDAAGGWNIFDSSRSSNNVNGNLLNANLSDAEYTQSPYNDFLSNGFKIRTNDTGQTTGNENQNGSTYIYMAFAESPFNFSNAR